MITGLAIVLVLAALGMPLFAVIAAIALLGFHAAGYDLIAVAVEYYRLSDRPGLIAIPMFTLAGYLLGESGTPTRLVRLSMALLGWLLQLLVRFRSLCFPFNLCFTNRAADCVRDGCNYRIRGSIISCQKSFHPFKNTTGIDF